MQRIRARNLGEGPQSERSKQAEKPELLFPSCRTKAGGGGVGGDNSSNSKGKLVGARRRQASHRKGKEEEEEAHFELLRAHYSSREAFSFPGVFGR